MDELLRVKINQQIEVVKKPHTSIFVTPTFSRGTLISISDKNSANAKRLYFDSIFEVIKRNIRAVKRLETSVGVLVITNEIVSIDLIERMYKELNKLGFYDFQQKDPGYYVGVDSDTIYWRFRRNDRHFNSKFETSKSIDASAKMVAHAKKCNLGRGIYFGHRYKNASLAMGLPAFSVIKDINYKVYSYTLHHQHAEIREPISLFSRQDFSFDKAPTIFSFVDIVASSKLLYSFDGKDVLAAKYKMFKNVKMSMREYNCSYRGDALFMWTKLSDAQDVLDNIVDLMNLISNSKRVQQELQFRNFEHSSNLVIINRFKIRISSDHTDGARFFKSGEPISQHAMFNEFINDYAPINGIVIGLNPFDTLGLDANYATKNISWAPGGYCFYEITPKFMHDNTTTPNVKKLSDGKYFKRWEIIVKGKSINFNRLFGDRVKNWGAEAKVGGSYVERDAREVKETTSYNGIHYYKRKNVNNTVPINDMDYSKKDIYEK